MAMNQVLNTVHLCSLVQVLLESKDWQVTRVGQVCKATQVRQVQQGPMELSVSLANLACPVAMACVESLDFSVPLATQDTLVPLGQPVLFSSSSCLCQLCLQSRYRLLSVYVCLCKNYKTTHQELMALQVIKFWLHLIFTFFTFHLFSY